MLGKSVVLVLIVCVRAGTGGASTRRPHPLLPTTPKTSLPRGKAKSVRFFRNLSSIQSVGRIKAGDETQVSTMPQVSAHMHLHAHRHMALCAVAYLVCSARWFTFRRAARTGRHGRGQRENSQDRREETSRTGKSEKGGACCPSVCAVGLRAQLIYARTDR